MVQGLPFSWVGGSGSEMANRLPTTPTPRSPYLPAASGQAFGDKPDPGLVFLSFGAEGPWGYLHAWVGKGGSRVRIRDTWVQGTICDSPFVWLPEKQNSGLVRLTSRVDFSLIFFFCFFY